MKTQSACTPRLGRRFASLLIAASISLAIGCQTVVDVDLAEFEPRLAAFGFISPDSIWNVLLYRNASMQQPVKAPQLLVAGAQVAVSGKDGRVVLEEDSAGYYTHDGLPEVGQTYVLEVQATGYPDIRAEGHVPPRPSVEVTLMDVEYGRRENRIEFSLDDPAGENFYRVGLFSLHGDEWSTIGFSTTDPAIKFSPDLVGVINLDDDLTTFNVGWFGDELFEGTSRTIALDFRHYVNPFDFPVLVVTSMSKDYFEYHRTLELQYWNSGDPFTSPVDVYSNVTGGSGVFGGYANTVIEVRPEE